MSRLDWLRHCLTERDNATFDVGRILAVLAILEFLGLTAYVVVWQGKAWDMQAFGIAVAAVFTGLGAYITLKREEK